MSNLSAFLKQAAIQPENQKVVVSKRFVDENGEPIEWEVRAITAEEDEKLRASSSRRISLPGKKNQFTESMDQAAYFNKLATVCTVYPNLNDVELQNSYGVMSAEQLLGKMLLAGEMQAFIAKIGEISGFDTSFEDQVDEAKN